MKLPKRYKCDLCKVNYDDDFNMYHIKVKSDLFVNYVNEGIIGANKRTIDVCECCVKKILDYIKA